MPSEERPVMILCDWAEVMNGKLYVMGGGISEVTTIGGSPVNLALGILLFVPWQQTNTMQKIRIVLVTEDGEPVSGPDEKPLIVEGSVEAGRPPGTRHGVLFHIPLAIRLPMMNLPEGRFRYELSVSGSLEVAAAFTVKNQDTAP